MSNLPLFPVSLLGSLPRPRWLIQVLRDRDAGNIPDVEWQQLAEHAVRDAVQVQEAAGMDIVTDGEQRRDGFLTFVADRLFGLRRMSLSERIRLESDPRATESRLTSMDVPLNALKSPVVSDSVRILNPNKGIVLEEVDYLAQQTTRPIRVAIPGPYTLSRSIWTAAHSQRVYDSPDALGEDFATLVRDEIRQLVKRGVSVVQLDEPSIAALTHSASESTFRGAWFPGVDDLETECASAVRLINDTFHGIQGIERVIHISQANWSRTVPSALNHDLSSVISVLEMINVDQINLSAALTTSGLLQAIRQFKSTKRIGLGVVSARSDRVESVDEIVEHARTALQHLSPEQLCLTPDTGFAPFAERNLNTTETAQAKLSALAEAAVRLRRG
ncbi:MAG: vitamin-B12 independent methionine synthase [Chloroflexota bacterium]